MNSLAEVYNQILNFLTGLDLTETVVVSINLILMVFAKRILARVYHEADTSPQFRIRLTIFRLFNLSIIIAFTFYHMYLPDGTKGWAFKLVAILVTCYLAYAAIHITTYIIRLRYGKTREINGTKQVTETYNSRMLSIISSVFIFIIALISVIRSMGFESMLEAGGVIGFIGVFLALTQSAWAPDLFSGLIILNSGMVDVGDVIEFNDADKRSFGVVYKTKIFHTEILNLVNNHRIMIKNSRLRDYTIHNLSKFASAKGLRENLHFKIGYQESEQRVRDMFQKAFKTAVANSETDIEEGHPPEIRVIETGDYAVEWCIFYYTKNVKNLLKTRQLFLEIILQTSKETGISLATPTLHVIEPNQQLNPA